MGLFGPGKRERQLESENASLKERVRHLETLAQVQAAEKVASLHEEAERLSAAVKAADDELATVRNRIIETDDIALLQEAGIYRLQHPLADAVAYKTKLTEVDAAIKSFVKGGTAIHTGTGWTVNGSAQKGAKMTRDLARLMLRAYNSEAENIVRTLRPHSLGPAIARLDKARETIAKLGTVVQLRVSDDYHRWRVYELELTADYLAKVEEEKERLREERARQREEQKALREMEAEKNRLEKERAHYQAALARLRERGDADAAAQMEGRIAEIDSAIVGIENREANIRAGYVYVISNFGSFGEHVVKIGLTRRLDPLDRVRELGDASVPFNFDVHALVFSEDAVGLETALHQRFADKRVNLVNMRREFFYVTPQEVRTALEEIGKQQLLEFHDEAEAPEWRVSGGTERVARILANRLKY